MCAANFAFHSPTYEADCLAAARDKRQDEGESVCDYVTEKLRLMDCSGHLLIEKQLIFQVHEGLHPKIETGMTGHMTVTIANLMELAVAVEVSLRKQAVLKVSTKDLLQEQGKKSIVTTDTQLTC